MRQRTAVGGGQSGAAGPVRITQPSPSEDSVIGEVTRAIKTWEQAVVWKGPVVRVQSKTSNRCVDDPARHILSFNQVGFYSYAKLTEACGQIGVGCWTSIEDQGIGSLEEPSGSQSIVLNEERMWFTIGKQGCTQLRTIMVHESGHAFGLSHKGKAQGYPTDDAIMFTPYHESKQFCQPTLYDVVAMMANYQSR